MRSGAARFAGNVEKYTASPKLKYYVTGSSRRKVGSQVSIGSASQSRRRIYIRLEGHERPMNNLAEAGASSIYSSVSVDKVPRLCW
jgi:hypothetical protein